MTTTDSKAPLRTVKRVQFGILAPDEIVSIELEYQIIACCGEMVYFALRDTVPGRCNRLSLLSPMRSAECR